MVIWPVSALRMAAKAHEELYAAIRKDGGTHRLIDRMQTRAELYATIGYHEYEALDSSIITSVAPEGMPQAQPVDDCGPADGGLRRTSAVPEPQPCSACGVRPPGFGFRRRRRLGFLAAGRFLASALRHNGARC